MAITKIEFSKCIPLTGVRRKHWSGSLSQLVDGVHIIPGKVQRLASWAVFLRLRAEDAFLSFERKDASAAVQRIMVEDAARDFAIEAYARSGHPVRSDQLKDEWCVVRSDGPKASRDISLTIKINTSHELFKKACEPSKHEPLCIEVLVDVLGAEEGESNTCFSRGQKLQIVVPLGRLEKYYGVVALDFGNTGSTMIAIDAGGGGSPASRLIPCDQKLVEAEIPLDLAAATKWAQPVPTTIELIRRDEVRGLASYIADYGSVAKETKHPERLIMGAKRMLSDLPKRMSEDQKIQVDVGGNAMRVLAHEPAECFMTRMFEAFHYFMQKEPTRIAITCPTTFTEREATRLRATAISALNRAAGRTATSININNGSENDEYSVRPCLDEATAAAFYFVDREAFQRKGGIAEFQYLYPEGMNLLIYDCGGGTTDISLVNIRLAGSSELSEMFIEILGRAGHREFGGDFITKQIVRLLKYRIAQGKDGREGIRDFGRDVKNELEKFEREGLLERHCPTYFKPEEPQSEEKVKRQKLAWHLWNLAETIKCQSFGPGAEGGDSSKLQHGVGLFLAGIITNETNVEELLTTSQEKGYWPDSVNWSIKPSWIDALIDEKLGETIDRANQLISARLKSASGGLYDVHRVYVVGNASRFPLIRERMLDDTRGLRIRFLSENLRDSHYGLASEDLKNCVAKGAAIALSIEQEGQLKVHWDTSLMKKLPYDIVHKTVRDVHPRVLFRQGTLDSKLEIQQIEILDDKADHIFLGRTWPGEPQPEKQLVFRFDHPMTPGDYRILYDMKDSVFKAYPEKNKQNVAEGESHELPPFVAPAQSGEI